MSVSIVLTENKFQTCRVPLGVLGYCLTQSGLLSPLWEQLEFSSKTYQHSPTEKLQDILVGVLAGCRSLSQTNMRIRPDKALAQAWQRHQFAEQSNLSRTLDNLTQKHVEQLRAGHLTLLRRHSQLLQHDWSQMLVLDIDPTSLLASKHAEGSRKGWVSGHRNQYCRHVLRFMVAGYHETLFSVVFPGNRHGFEHFKPAIQALLQYWPWPKTQRQQIILRTDAGLGTDVNVSYGLWLGFHILMKAYSGRRTQAWLKRLPEDAWIADSQRKHRWMAPAPKKLRLGRRMDAYLLRWHNQKRQLQHATLLTTLSYTPFALWNLYDGRGSTEIEIRADKSGLKLHLRRKQSLTAMEGWVILTDIAHNLIAWMRRWAFANTSFEAFGPQRIVEDLFTIPGQLWFENGRLTKVALDENHPYAENMQFCLHNLLKTFDLA